MARRTVVVDDLSEEMVDEESAHVNVALSFEGRSVVLDLANETYDTLAEALEPFLAAGRTSETPRMPRLVTPRSPSTPRKTGQDRDLTDVREWARSNGFNVSERGRISYAVLDAYDQAQGQPAKKASSRKR